MDWFIHTFLLHFSILYNMSQSPNHTNKLILTSYLTFRHPLINILVATWGSLPKKIWHGDTHQPAYQVIATQNFLEKQQCLNPLKLNLFSPSLSVAIGLWRTFSHSGGNIWKAKLALTVPLNTQNLIIKWPQRMFQGLCFNILDTNNKHNMTTGWTLEHQGFLEPSDQLAWLSGCIYRLYRNITQTQIHANYAQ